MKIAILILAAGSSTRMGRPKQLLALNHTTLLGVAIENALQSEVENIFCVLGAEFEKVKASIKNFNVKIINNTAYKSGLSTSIVEGIKHINSTSFDAVLIMLGDQPKIDSVYLNSLINVFKDNQNKIVASNYKNSLGVPAIFPKHSFSELLKLKGDKGAKDVLNSKSKTIMSIEPASELLDIDSEEDYLNYLKSL